MQLILDQQQVNDYLIAHGLEEGCLRPSSTLLQMDGTESGQPCVLMIVEVAGKKQAVKLSMNMLIAVTVGMRSGAEARGWVQDP